MNKQHDHSSRGWRWAPLIAGVTLAVTALGGCSTATSAAESEAGLPVFQVNLGHFTIEPAELTLPAGRFLLVVTNVDTQLPHSLVLLKRSTQVLAPGQSQTLTVKSGQEPVPGDYVMFCDVPGHLQMGQKGVVHVVAETTMVTVTP